MTHQLCFRGLKPTCPTMRTPSVARVIAERIVAEVNLDEFYWTSDELPDRIADVAEEIVAHGNPRTVIERLHRKEGPDVGGGLWGWEGQNSHCYAIAGEIAAEEVEAAVAKWREGLRELTKEKTMPGQSDDSYDPEWGTAANGAEIDDALEEVYDRLSGILGGKPPLWILDLVRADLPTPIAATLSEREWRLLRFAVERARDSI